MKKLLVYIGFLMPILCFAQSNSKFPFSSDYICPYCDAHISSTSTVCWCCRSDLTEFRAYMSKQHAAERALAVAAISAQEKNLANARAQKSKTNEQFMIQANAAVNNVVNSYEKSFSEIEEMLPLYYESYNIDVLNQVRSRFNNVIRNFSSSVSNISDQIEECDGGPYLRLNDLVDKTNQLRVLIESAKSFIPDQFVFDQFTITKKDSRFYISLPDSFSSPSLVVPATCRFNYSEIPISGIENADLSQFTNLESIVFQGNLSLLNLTQLNSCPNLKKITFSGSDNTPPLLNGSILRDSITVFVSQNAIIAYCKLDGWKNTLIVAKGEDTDLYAKDGVLYKYDIIHSEVSLQHYYETSVKQPIFLPSINNIPITIIEDNAFENSKIANIIIPSTVKKIGDSAFSQCMNLKSITIPSNVVSIGRNAFHNCTKLKDITIEGKEPPSAFINSFPSGCWINVTPSSFDTYLENAPWSDLKRIREIGEVTYRAYDGSQLYLINEDSHSANLIKGTNVSQLSLSNSVFDGEFTLSVINSRAFDGCDKLTTLTIPASVTTIEPEAFFGVPNLTAIYSLHDVPANCEAPIFEKKNTCLVYVPKDAIPLYRKQKGWRSANKIVSLESTKGMVSSTTQKDNNLSLPFAKTSSSYETEPLHILFGVDALFHNQAITEIGALMSIGGHSNTLNFEVGLNAIGVIYNRDDRIHINFVNSDRSLDFSFLVRSRINLIKKDYNGPYSAATRKGTDYSSLYLYVAPEALYFGNLLYPNGSFFDNVDYGIRAGVGFGFIDLSIGYLFKLETISFGISFYMSNK